MLAVTTGLSGVPAARAVLRSAPPNRRPWSDGLSGEPSIRTMTSSGFGSGVATVTSEISTMPSFRTVERIWRPLSMLVSAMSGLRVSDLLHPVPVGELDVEQRGVRIAHLRILDQPTRVVLVRQNLRRRDLEVVDRERGDRQHR